MGGRYYCIQRVRYDDAGLHDPTLNNNVRIGSDPIIVRPRLGPSANVAPSNLGNQRIMLVNTASNLGKDGTGNSLATIVGSSFSIPYRSDLFPAETGSLNFTRTSGSTARLVVTTTGGPLAGLQRNLSLSYDSTTTGIYSYTATHLGVPADSGSGFFYGVGPITSHLELINSAPGQSAVVRLRWTGGAPPFTVEHTPALGGVSGWSPVLAPASGSADLATNLVLPLLCLPAGDSTGFFRVIGQ
jgi:hypothetical protein